MEWITSADVVAKYRIDPARIALIGHSTGGYMALSAAAHHAGLPRRFRFRAHPSGAAFAGWKPEDKDKAVAQYAARTNPADLLPLAGTSANALGGKVFDHRDEWDFLKLAPVSFQKQTAVPGFHHHQSVSGDVSVGEIPPGQRRRQGPRSAGLRIPAKEIAHSDLMSIKIEASSRWTVTC